MRIGNITLKNQLVVAPMAGVTDRPFRQLCKRLGAGMAVSEMVASDSRLWATEKSLRRGDHTGEVNPIVVQIAGAAPEMMAEAARYNVDKGAHIIDINMGCPAKKVCKVDAGSALMKDEKLVGQILEAVVSAVEVPVTLKIRTGWDREHKNALAIARIAEDSGIQSLAVHGRTRSDLYEGDAEYDTIRAVKQSVSIPVVANGDIDSPQKARFVLDYTGCDAVMIGRAAQGRPWIFREIAHYLETGRQLAPPDFAEIHAIASQHLAELHLFYGSYKGLRVARKHIGWYLAGLPGGEEIRQTMNLIEEPDAQIAALDRYFVRLIDGEMAGVRRAA
ncbi:MAG: tRNA dihydrouridine synthase DusB [Betaproteobacteria bacterium]|nr:tRNA dihydrouridine synthase DusB [Betaproteobacteria bacterium]